MYTLLGIDAVLRITAALLLLFVGVPALARRKPEALDRMEWFWWCAAAMIAGLTIAGQLLTLLNIFDTLTLLLVFGAVIVLVRARRSGRRPGAMALDWYRNVVRVSLHALEGRVNVRRRIRRAFRRARMSRSGGNRRHLVAWIALIVVAAALRFYRPFVTANLGFSDTYVHLYLMRLLEKGQQVDPAWGPYPRGMHFLLMAIRELTNVDVILLMNFFGPAAGVLMTLAVADAARRLTRNLTAGIVAGALFATMLGGGGQYFLLGGSMATDRVEDARAFVALPFDAIPPTRGEFDVLATVFQRQTATLPQELAIAFLFPAAMFLLGWFRHRNRWHLSGFLFCTATIAAVHPGVAVPLVLLSAIAVIATLPGWRDIRTAALTGLAGIVLGSTWMVAYIAYPYSGAPRPTVSANDAGSAAAYYFPFLRGGTDAQIVTYVAITPFLIACAVIAVALLIVALSSSLRAKSRSQRSPYADRAMNGEGSTDPSTSLGINFAGPVFAALTVLLFLFTHVASRFRLPEIVEVRRNASWLAMALAILLGIAVAEILRTRITKIAAMAVALLWLWRVPVASAHERLIDYSGYSATAYAVLEIQRELEPFTWTLITYGQEFPMVLGRGFHMTAVEFLDRYDPAGELSIPTPYVFIAVEKTPHPFEINTWAAQFSRADIQQRLQTWCFLYQRTHRNMHIFRDDEKVRVYIIRKTL
ncbi:MAG TPA: hypothetical protein VNI54_11060 [Thermoanaerobaculia bacterium]|nr:hypothetical protein [Thermoanaerobaculia bacterium]